MRRLVLLSSLVVGLLVAMAVNAAAAGETWTPSSFNFGQVAIGASSAPKSFTLKASSVSNYDPFPEVFNSDDFRVTPGSCGGTLPPNGTCTASVVFAPTSPGSKSGTLRGSASSSEPQAPLTGVGVTPSATTPGKKKCKKKGKKSAVAAKKCKKK
jgi:hypothetical protein